MTCPNCRFVGYTPGERCSFCRYHRIQQEWRPSSTSQDDHTTFKWIVAILIALSILGAAWAQNVQEPEDHGDYYMDTPMYCGAGRC